MNRKYRKTVIAGNWKMNKLASEAKPFVEELRAAMPKTKTCESVLCVPFPIIPAMAKVMRDSRLAFGAQDVSAHESGAYTGEVSAAMLADLGVKYCIVGHSERREYHAESDSLVNTKAKALLAAGITPIICVGESLEQRERELTMEYVAYQVKAALAGMDAREVKKCVIAYEPIWAIGTGRTATADQAQEVCAAIRKVVGELYGADIAEGMTIQYGGSMNPANAAELLSKPDVDGGLIGGASLHAGKFCEIVEAATKG